MAPASSTIYPLVRVFGSGWSRAKPQARVTCELSYIKLEAASSHLSHHVDSKPINNANRDSQELGGKKRAGPSHA